MKSKQVYFISFAILLALVALSGCMAGAGADKKPEDNSVLRTRAVERWDLLIAHKADKAWDYLSPGYRQTKPRDVYAKEMNERPVRWTKVAFNSQDCDADVCKVHLAVDYNINMGGLVGNTHSMSFVVETWVKVNGRWFHLPEQFQPAKLGGNS